MTTNNLYLVGDCHGKFKELFAICDQYRDKQILCLGDMGFGWGGNPSISELPKNLAFINGNHSWPEIGWVHPQYAGKFGIWNGVFLLDGADSIDKNQRQRGIDWWASEELLEEEFEEAYELYKQEKPEILVSHEAPFHIHKILIEVAHVRNPNSRGWGPAKGNRTAFWLDRMYQIHKPRIHYFGHHHCDLKFTANKITYQCLDELQVLPINVPSV